MFNLLSGVSAEIRVILLFGFIGLMIMIAGSILIVGLRRQAIEDSGRFDIPSRKKKEDKPAKVKKVKVPKIKAGKTPKPEKVKSVKAEKVKPSKPEKVQKEKPVKAEKSKKGGLFKKAAKPTGLTLLAAPVGSTVMPERATSSPQEPTPAPAAAAPSLLAQPKEFDTSDDFDIIPATTSPSTFGQTSEDDFDILPPVASPSTFGESSDDDFDILPAVTSEPKIVQSSDDDFDIDSFDLPTQTKGTPSTSGPFGAKTPTGDEEW